MIIINKYRKKILLIAWLLDWINKLQYRKVSKNYINFFCNEPEPPIFMSVEIETINRCNMTCEFCPVNRNTDKREFLKMEWNLFTSIIDQLAEMNFAGKIALFSNNEPFLDERMPELAKYAKERCEKAFIHIYTNATVLDLDTFKKTIPYLDRMIIDNYNDKLVMNKTTKNIYEYCTLNNVYQDKVQIHYRKIHEKLFTRGGTSPNNQKKRTIKELCLMPYRQLVVRPDGKVSLCCNDAYGTYTLGDLNRQSIKEVWNSVEYMEIRKKLRDGRKNISLCQFCDTIHPGA